MNQDRKGIYWFYRSLPRRSRVRLLIAVSLIFAPIGAFQAPGLEQGRLVVLVWAVFSGAVAVGWALAFLQDIRFLWVLIPLQLSAAVLLQRWAPPELAFEDFLCSALIVLGYVFFISFIKGEGLRNLRLQTEVALAQEIHADLVPPVDRICQGVQLYGRSIPSSEVGGDLIDVVEQGGKVGVFVADVTGHGLPASVLMTTVKGALRMGLLGSPGLGTLLSDLNRVLYDVKGRRMFVTLACLRFDGHRSAEYALAGHPPIIHCRPAGDTLSRLSMPSLPLGALRDRQPPGGESHQAGVVELEPGDLLVLLTDGLTEVLDGTGKELGQEAVEAVVAENSGLPLEELYELIMGTVRRHGKQLDDQTLLLARVVG